MMPAILPQAAPVGFPRMTIASDHGNAVYGHARASNRLSARSTATEPRRDDVLDSIIREAEGASPRAAHRPNIATALPRDVDHEARPQHRGVQVEAQARCKSTTSLVAHLACGLFKQRRSDGALCRRTATDLQIIPRQGAETSSKWLDEHARACRGSS